MEPKGISLGRGGVAKTGDGFIDRSKVRILLCDNDSKGSGEVFTLLRKCSYQVISVKSQRQVIDALNAEGPNIDLILSEVDLPMAKGLKMLKYIMRKELQRIPVIMMSAQDEVTLVVKCLRLGAADYLVKPLRTNELLNLWTHMWRRRRMLGLTEKKLMNCEFDLVYSDHSDVNTNSTTVFSDDTDERPPRKIANCENEINVDKKLVTFSNNQSYLPETNGHQPGQFMCGPKKSELKIGESSAFFTYIKSNISRKTTPVISRLQKEPSEVFQSIDLPKTQMQQGYNGHSAYPYHHQGAAMNQVMMSVTSSPSSMLFQNNIDDSHNHNHHHHHYYPHHHHQMHGMMTSFPYYQQSGMTWASSSSSKDQKLERREAALMKFRQKRKERCYDKKIRYVNRKKLAERRPRVRGQFVRKVNGIDVDLNGHPTCTDFDDDVEYDDDDDAGG